MKDFFKKDFTSNLERMVKCGICRKNVKGEIEYHINRFHPELIGISQNSTRTRRNRDSRRKGIVVDGNNVAYAQGQPKVANIKQCRAELIKRGFDPYIVVSSALIHRIDKRDELLRLVRLGWLIVAEEDESDDIEVIETAMRLNLDIVSNDRYLDHRDKYGERYDFSRLQRFVFAGGKFSLV